MKRTPIVQRTPITNDSEIYGYIYITTNNVNGKQYIGQRAWRNPNKTDSYLGSGVALIRAIKKYGKQNFHKDILCWAYTKTMLDELERLYISKYGAVESDEYYNIQAGGGSWEVGQLSGEKNPFYGRHHDPNTLEQIRLHLPSLKGQNNPNYRNTWNDTQRQKARERMLARNLVGEKNPNYGNKWSDEQKAHMSKHMKGKYAGEKSWNYGKPKSEETKEKLRIASTGRTHTEESRRKMSEKRQGEDNSMYGKGYKVTGERNGMYGKTHSEETRAKMRENHYDCSGRNNPTYGSNHPLSKGVVKMSLTGEKLKVFESVGEAAREENANRTTIRRHCEKGGIYHGFLWKWND